MALYIMTIKVTFCTEVYQTVVYLLAKRNGLARSNIRLCIPITQIVIPYA